MFAAQYPHPINQEPGGALATAIREALIQSDYLAYLRKAAQEAARAIPAPSRGKGTTQPRKRREKRAQRTIRRSIAADAFLAAAVNRLERLTRRHQGNGLMKLPPEQLEIAASLLSRTQGPVMAIRGKAPLLFSWRAE